MSEDISRVKVPYKFIRHQDFMPMANQPSELIKCNFCHTIFIGEKKVFSELDKIYHGEDYAKNKKTEHVLFNQTDVKDEAMKTTYSYFADFIAKQISLSENNNECILDIGCFDGKLLIELNKRFPNATMHGFDVSAYIKEIFPKHERFTYFS